MSAAAGEIRRRHTTKGQRPGGHVAIDMDSLVSELEGSLHDVDSSMNKSGAGEEDSPECLISKVDDQTRGVRSSDYDPYRAHIGAYHYRDQRGSEVTTKLNILAALFPAETERSTRLRTCLTNEFASLAERARWYYSDPIQCVNMEQFARMLLLDACYILAFFDNVDPAVSSLALPAGESDTIHRHGGYHNADISDVLYLLENQIPFTAIEEIYRLIHRGSTDDVVVDAVKRVVSRLLSRQGYSVLDVPTSPRPCHLVHFLHKHFMEPVEPAPRGQEARDQHHEDNQLQRRSSTAVATDNNNGDDPCPLRWRLATQYEIAGVRFQRRDLDAGQKVCSVLDVELRGRTLRVPSLTVDDNTWRMLRNLMALEQRNPGVGSHVTAYCFFMSQMASTEKDVAFLAKKEIIAHMLGSDREVADGFFNLCKGIAIDLTKPDRNYLRETMKKLELRYKRRRYTWMAWLRRNHLSKPFLFVTIIGFFCGVIQAVFAIVSYVKPPK